MHPEDLAEPGFADRDLMDVVSKFQGRTGRRRSSGWSNTPGSKAMFVRFVSHTGGAAVAGTGALETV